MVDKFLNTESRIWNVAEDSIGKHDLQEIVTCAEEGDTIILTATSILQFHDVIKISKNLTIRGPIKNDSKTSLTCPQGKALFQFT